MANTIILMRLLNMILAQTMITVVALMIAIKVIVVIMTILKMRNKTRWS